MSVPKEQIRQIISENNITSVADVYALLKDSFKDILQKLMEAELDATLGYEKNRKGDLQTDNKRNGHSIKTLKSQYGEFQIDVPRDRNGEFEPKLIPKYQRDISGIEEKVISLYARGMSTRDIHDQLNDLYGIAKGNMFCLVQHIRSYAQTIFPAYYEDCMCMKENPEGFIHVFTKHYADLNVLHPFREGNGRTQREFARELCLKCGYALDLTQTGHEEMLSASIMSFDKGDNAGLEAVFRKCIRPLSSNP